MLKKGANALPGNTNDDLVQMTCTYANKHGEVAIVGSLVGSLAICCNPLGRETMRGAPGILKYIRQKWPNYFEDVL